MLAAERVSHACHPITSLTSAPATTPPEAKSPRSSLMQQASQNHIQSKRSRMYPWAQHSMTSSSVWPPGELCQAIRVVERASLVYHPITCPTSDRTTMQPGAKRARLSRTLSSPAAIHPADHDLRSIGTI